jgi:hypothetical protein
VGGRLSTISGKWQSDFQSTQDAFGGILAL